MRIGTLVMLLALLFVSAGTGSATTILFSDRATFESATGATAVGPVPGGASSSSFTIGGLTFSQEAPASLNTSVNWSTLISEPFDLAINGVENFNVDSAAPIFSFGFDFHEPSQGPPPTFPDTCNAPCFDSTFQITLLLGAATVGTHTFNRPDDTLAFVGVWSSAPFDRIEIRDLTNTIDNEFFGNFLTGTTALPEPASLWILAAGALAVMVRRRRSR